MKKAPALLVFLTLAVAVASVVYLALPAGDTAQDWEQRRTLFQDATVRAVPLIESIKVYTSTIGNPPRALADMIPEYLNELPVTGLPACERFEYRSLAHKQGAIVWYDLGSRQGQPYSGQSRFSEGDPDHAILIFTLDAQGKISSALLDRLPKGREPVDFDPERWKSVENRIEMALDLSDTYRLHGMPRDVFEPLLGPPDGSRVVHGAAWELRINCPTGLLNHDALVYWPTESYPQHLYGGNTEAIGRWVYIHSE